MALKLFEDWEKREGLKIVMKKSAVEIRCIKAAAKASEAGFRAILDVIRPGMTESELCGIATRAMTAVGAESTGYPVWCCSWPNSWSRWTIRSRTRTRSSTAMRRRSSA